MKIAALICTILSAIGGIVILTKSAPIAESAPPTALYAFVAILCWGTFLKKQSREKAPAKHTQLPIWKRKELWEDYPAPNYDGFHKYCKVAFDDSGKTYYYRTRNPELKIGDAVYVPFGYNEPKKIGVIVSMEVCRGQDAPFPLEKTKFIDGKVKKSPRS